MKKEKYDFCIIGGGFQGLILAYYLSSKHKVLLVEKEPILGGVLSGFKLGSSYLEKFYHHFFPSDKNLLGLIEELGLSNKIIWKKTKSGFYSNGRIYPFVSPLDVLKFKPLSFKDKIILSLFMLRIKIVNPKKIDGISAKEWIIKNSSPKVYKNLFEPLLINKFGTESLDKISAAWLVSRIKLRSNAKGGKETLGYLNKGFQQLIESLKKKILENKSEILVSRSFIKFKEKDNDIKEAVISKKRVQASYFISTIPPARTFNSLKLLQEFSSKIRDIEYQGNICIILGLKNKISSLYWTNILDSRAPFRAIIQQTSLTKKEEYGAEVVYLSSYHDSSSKIWGKNNKLIIQETLDYLKKFNVTRSEVLFAKIFKEQFAGVLAKKGYFENLGFKTPYNNLFIVGMFNTYPERGLELQLRLGRNLINSIENEK